MTEETKLKLSLAYLYPELLNIYGDFGNVLTIKNRCEWRGIEFELTKINLGDEIDSEKFDFYFIGGGQDKQQIDVSREMQRLKNSFHDAMNLDAVFLGICGGYQLFGSYYQPHNGARLLGLELLNAYTVAGNKRFIGNVTAKTEFTVPKTLVGFENHSGLTYLKGDTKPLAMVEIGAGNNNEDKSEGARFKNVFGTYLHGSFLPKNPHFADFLIRLALEKHYKDNIELVKLNDELELQTHISLLNKAY
jgi:lipid II isoglutaminyl synthase (glutamine-hydrolysing)